MSDQTPHHPTTEPETTAPESPAQAVPDVADAVPTEQTPAPPADTDGLPDATAEPESATPATSDSATSDSAESAAVDPAGSALADGPVEQTGSAPETTTAETTGETPEIDGPLDAGDAPASPETSETSETREHTGAPRPAATPAAVPAPPTGTSPSAVGDATRFGRVGEDGTVFVRIGDEEREVGSYPGAAPDEALAYFARKFDEVASLADLLHQRVTQTDLSAKDGADGLARLRAAVAELRAVGDFAHLYARIEDIATAVEVRKATESQERSAAREQAIQAREAIVAEAEKIAAQPENKVQWKASSARMRALLDEWKAAQKQGPKLDRESEQALWQRLSSSRNSFDKMRRVHFAQLGSQQSEAKARKEELVQEAEKLSGSTDWGQTAGAFKRLMDQWRQAGRAARSDDDALWKRFKAAQDAFFAAKDEVSAAENVEFEANLKVKEELLEQARAILPVTDVDAAKARLRPIQEKWDAAGKVPRSAIKRMEDGMRKVETAIREAEQKKWKRTDPEVAARAHSMVTQLESAVESLREDLAKAEARGDQRKITKAREALEAREAWLAQARAGLEEFAD